MPPLPPWDGDVRAARALQSELAARVRLVDEWTPPRWLGGFDVGFEDDGATTRAAAVLLDAATLQPAEHVVVRHPTRMPYIPGLLSFRELPALLDALAALSRAPDLAFVDGLGVAHPRRFGIAAHFGLASALPTIGVAKRLLTGTHAPLADEVGACVPLVDGDEVIGTVLRSKARCRPLVVSPGHRVSFEAATDWVLRTLRGYRLPEPTRWADRVASRRGER
ncbi:deoxyribonuclease V [Tolypothrix campylonemoides VB511288]|nr:deoxyribonuclease V [Tolypothrix campylonemoides VB511288]